MTLPQEFTITLNSGSVGYGKIDLSGVISGAAFTTGAVLTTGSYMSTPGKWITTNSSAYTSNWSISPHNVSIKWSVENIVKFLMSDGYSNA